MGEINRREIHGQIVNGVDVDSETRCSHWHSALDIIAIKFACCDGFYSCYDCHAALSRHEAKQWPAGSQDEEIVLCGSCGRLLTLNEYLNCAYACPGCGSAFNPNCSRHAHLYFE